MKLKLSISGHTVTDLENALDEAKKLISQGYRAATDSNSNGKYFFEVRGEAVVSYAIKRKERLLKARFDRFEEAEEEISDGDIIVGIDKNGDHFNLDC